MKQIIGKKGKVIIEDIPAPATSDNTVLVKVAYSCISTGTEIASIDSSGQSLINKALQQPEKILKVYDSFKKEGLSETFKKVKGKVKSDSLIPLGYSAAGIVVNVGKNIKTLVPGDRVACAGAGIANHAEYIEVPRNLLVKVPDEVDLDVAATVTLGAISMQGVRRADVKLGEFVAVIGLGVLGQITLQLLMANGCRVIGIEKDQERIEKALNVGLDCAVNPEKEDPVKKALLFSNGYGLDSVIITAATSSYAPLEQAFHMCRKKGKVVLVGVVGMKINRDHIYEKELDFLISTSYGPGRYDEEYEKHGLRYPYSYVRWTETRNMEEYLKLIAEKKIAVKQLIEKEFLFEHAHNAYEALHKQDNRPLIVLLKYGTTGENTPSRKIVLKTNKCLKNGKINIALIGAGNFSQNMHLPNLVTLKDKYTIYAIVSKTGLTAASVAKEYNAHYATTDYKEVLRDENVHAVIIATRHNLHVRMAIDALQAGKPVFLEKPMSIHKKELDELVSVIEQTQMPFMVGFNRRFSKYATEIKKHIDKRINPMMITYQVNAGYIPLDSWVHSEEGGGRIIGEACHFFDLFYFFTDAQVETVTVHRIAPHTAYFSAEDNVVVTAQHKDGSVGMLVYTALGDSSYPKETCQIFYDGKVIVLNDYKQLEGYGVDVQKLTSAVSDKGHIEALQAFAGYVRGECTEPIPLWHMIQATEMTFAAHEQSL